MENEIIMSNPASLIELAIQKDADIEKLGKLMDLQERWEARQSAKLFKVAMSGFTSKKPELKKSKKVSFGQTNYKYLPLGRIQQAIDPILGEFGLSYRWEQIQESGLIKITCIISHIDGHTESTFMSAPADDSGKKNVIQSIGSTVSYLKRYTLEGALGLSSDDDDDGHSSSKPEFIDDRESLNPSAKAWEGAVSALKNDEVTIDQVVKKYKVTPQDKELLIKLSK